MLFLISKLEFIRGLNFGVRCVSFSITITCNNYRLDFYSFDSKTFNKIKFYFIKFRRQKTKSCTFTGAFFKSRDNLSRPMQRKYFRQCRIHTSEVKEVGGQRWGEAEVRTKNIPYTQKITISNEGYNGITSH